MNRLRGMTLIELLVAVFAFAVLASLAYAALGQMLNNSDRHGHIGQSSGPRTLSGQLKVRGK